MSQVFENDEPDQIDLPVSRGSITRPIPDRYGYHILVLGVARTRLAEKERSIPKSYHGLTTPLVNIFRTEKIPASLTEDKRRQLWGLFSAVGRTTCCSL